MDTEHNHHAHHAADEDEQRVDGFYRALISLRIHHDRMLWSRVQLLIAVQGVVIGGSYAVGDHTLASVFLVAGAVLSLVVYEPGDEGSIEP